MNTRAPNIRFFEKVNKTENCWIWCGAILKTSGYGQFNTGHNVLQLAHRFSYEYHKGKIPAGLVIDHLCRDKRCVNPDHLEAVTQKENTNRGQTGWYNKLKTHCNSGHEFTEENTYTYKVSGKRRCNLCARRWNKEMRLRNKEISSRSR